MLKHKVAVSCCILIWSSISQAFLNIESLRQSDKTGFFGSSNLKITGASGNTDKSIGVAATQNSYVSGRNEYLLLSQYSYGEASGTKDTHNGNVHLRYTRGFTDIFSWEWFTQLEFNEFTDLESRALLGTGLRSELLKDENHTLFLGTGFFYETEEIETQRDQKALRGNIYLSYRSFVRKTVEASIIFYYQPSTKRLDDYRFQLDTGLSFKIYGELSFTAEAKLSFDSKPPPGIELTDITYLTGIAYEY